jgi:hypothetical protein
MSVRLEIDYLSGCCPVQSEGLINGNPFYFRSRGQRWQMAIGCDPVSISLYAGSKGGWYKEEPYGEQMFDAGYMEKSDAREIIERCAKEYAQTNEGTELCVKTKMRI